MRVELSAVGDAGPGVMKTVVIPQDDQRQGDADNAAIQFGDELPLRKAFDQVFELRFIKSGDDGKTTP